MTKTREMQISKTDLILAMLPGLESEEPGRAARYLSDDFVYIDAFPEPLDRDQYLDFLRLLKSAFPDWSHHLTQLQEEGEDVVHALMRRGGTHTGELHLPGLISIPPTGITISLPPEPIIFSFFEDSIDKIQVEAVPGGGLEGILRSLDVDLPWTYSGLWTKRLIK